MASTSTEVEDLISAKRVQVNGSFAATAAQLVLRSDSLELVSEKDNYVSRGGYKLEHALSTFGINPAQLDS